MVVVGLVPSLGNQIQVHHQYEATELNAELHQLVAVELNLVDLELNRKQALALEFQNCHL